MPNKRHTLKSDAPDGTAAAPPTCDYCGQPFERRRKHQRFCPGGRCRSEYYAERDRAAREAFASRGGDKNPAAVALGRLGGLASGRRRREIARERGKRSR